MWVSVEDPAVKLVWLQSPQFFLKYEVKFNACLKLRVHWGCDVLLVYSVHTGLSPLDTSDVLTIERGSV